MALKYGDWFDFVGIEKGILSKLGAEVWESYPPVEPGFLKKARKEQIGKKIKYEERVGRALKAEGIFAEYQFIFLNRRILDFCLPNQRIVIEIDDVSHLDAETIEKDKKKDELAAAMDFKTFRLKHPYRENELKTFVELIKAEFISVGGVLNSAESCADERKITRFKKVSKLGTGLSDYSSFVEEISKRLRGVANSKKKKKSILKKYKNLRRELKAEFRRKILVEIPEAMPRPFIPYVPVSKENTLIVRKKSGERKVLIA